jgi:hypothetical protein
MFVYSPKIAKFVQEIKHIIKAVLSKELHYTVSDNRFFDAKQRCSYPISVIIYNDKNTLGFFDPNFFQLGFHERLMHVDQNDLCNIIRHELAHYIVFIKNPHLTTPHGVDFRAFCKQVGWGEEVYRATMHVPDASDKLEDSDILRKVKKLMALSTSSNKNEAEQAMIKSRELLLKHNIEAKDIENSDDEKVFLKRIMKQPKKTAKMMAIAKILEVFFVNVVFSRGDTHTFLEILGSKVNLQIAAYVADVLNQQLDNLWAQTKHVHKLQGLTAKNSFLLGIAKGYCNKIQVLKKTYPTDVTQALVVIEQNLDKARDLVYERLSRSTSNRSHCPAASQLGEQVGKTLNINPAVTQASKKSGQWIDVK